MILQCESIRNSGRPCSVVVIPQKRGHQDCSLGELHIELTNVGGIVTEHFFDFIRVFWFVWFIKSGLIKSRYRLSRPPSLNSFFDSLDLLHGDGIGNSFQIGLWGPPFRKTWMKGREWGEEDVCIWIILLLLQYE